MTTENDDLKLQTQGFYPASFIKSSDKAAQSILRQIYSMLMDKCNGVVDDLSNPLERGFIDVIDDVYKHDSRRGIVVEEILREAYDILNETEEWDLSHKQLYEALEQVVILGTRQKSFKDHFDGLEDVVGSALQLDFDKRAPLTQIGKSKQNILNYASIIFNMVMEKLQNSVVSKKAFNTFFSTLADTGLIITNETLKIRFVNKYIEELFGLRNDQLINESLENHLSLTDAQLTELKEKGKIDPIRVKLNGNQGGTSILQLNLQVPFSIDEPNEIKEYVFILKNIVSISG